MKRQKCRYKWSFLIHTQTHVCTCSKCKNSFQSKDKQHVTRIVRKAVEEGKRVSHSISSVNFPFPFPFPKSVEHGFTALSTCMWRLLLHFHIVVYPFPLQRSSSSIKAHSHTRQALLVDLLCVPKTSAQICRCREMKRSATRGDERAHAQAGRHRNAYRKIRARYPVIYVKS